MAINIDESFLTEKALDYAKLSELAYADWKWGSNGWELDAYDEKKQLKKGYDRYLDIWRGLKAPEKGYTIVDHTPNDPLTGFSATIFQRDGKNILAIRGTKKNDPRDLWADGELLRGQLPAYQYESMVNYINEKMLTNFDVTGHSLGGCLAHAAKATFVGVKDVYTFNSPGAKVMTEGRV